MSAPDVRLNPIRDTQYPSKEGIHKNKQTIQYLYKSCTYNFWSASGLIFWSINVISVIKFGKSTKCIMLSLQRSRHCTKIEKALFVSSKLTFSNFLWYLNVPLMEQNQLKREISFEAISFETLHPAEAQNSNIIKNWRMSSLKGQVMSFPF